MIWLPVSTLKYSTMTTMMMEIKVVRFGGVVENIIEETVEVLETEVVETKVVIVMLALIDIAVVHANIWQRIFKAQLVAPIN